MKDWIRVRDQIKRMRDVIGHVPKPANWRAARRAAREMLGGLGITGRGVEEPEEDHVRPMSHPVEGEEKSLNHPRPVKFPFHEGGLERGIPERRMLPGGQYKILDQMEREALREQPLGWEQRSPERQALADLSAVFDRLEEAAGHLGQVEHVETMTSWVLEVMERVRHRLEMTVGQDVRLLQDFGVLIEGMGPRIAALRELGRMEVLAREQNEVAT